MYSNRYVALHCCQEKYFKEIKENGIERDTKAVFICDLNGTDNNELCNTLAVLIYHGIGVDGWNRFLKEEHTLKEINGNLVITIAKFSKEQENIIEDNKITNYYKICDKSEKTMNYCKIKDIGKIEEITFAERIPLDNISIKNTENINPAKDRFFIKNTYNDLEIKDNKTIDEIEKICYKIADENLLGIKKDIIRIDEHKMKGINNE